MRKNVPRRIRRDTIRWPAAWETGMSDSGSNTGDAAPATKRRCTDRMKVLFLPMSCTTTLSLSSSFCAGFSDGRDGPRR